MPVTFEHETLENGLTIIAEVDSSAHSAAVGYFVKTGARDESPEVMGVSHFLEHMMFKGTGKRSAPRLNADFDRIGAKNNAYTSHEMTCFHAQVIPERLLGEGGANEIIGDMLRPALRESDFDTEKGVILEEIAMYQDNPFWVVYEKTVERRYNGHSLGHRVLGTPETIKALTAGQMRAYFDHRYSADNTVVALAGCVDFARAVNEIRALCSSWHRTGASRDNSTPKFPSRGKTSPDVDIRDDKFSRGYAISLCPAPGATDPARYAASLLAQVLGGSDNSRFHWSLIETGIAEEAEAAYDPRDNTGDFLVFASGEPSRMDEIWSVAAREIAGLKQTLNEDDLAKIRAKAATGVTVAGERPGGRMQRLGRQWLYQGTYTTLEHELDQINAVTVDDLINVLEAYPLDQGVTGRLGPARA